MNGYGGMGMGFGMIWYWIIGIVFLVVIIWLIARVLNQNVANSQSRSALDILKERYARGEIDKDEFEEKKSHLVS
jgi:putative membrane protein